MPRRVTQNDIARRAGVSRVTVSNVLNSRPQKYIPIQEETRQRILAAAQELGYQANAAARSLRSGRSGTIGLLIPDASNPQYWAIVRGVEATAREHGCQLILSISGRELENEREALRALAQQRMDGLILLLHYPESFEDELEALKLHDAPLVTFNWAFPGKSVVLQRYDLGTAELMDHLLKLGHRRIGFIHGVARATLGRDRLLVYRNALTAAGLPVRDELIVRCSGTPQDGVAGAQRLLDLKPPPTAIVAVNDWIALGALQAAGQRGLRVPQDLSIAGFGDIEISSYLHPPLTTVRADFAKVGRQAANLLFQRLEDPGAPAQHVEIAAHLVVRESTGPCPQE